MQKTEWIFFKVFLESYMYENWKHWGTAMWDFACGDVRMLVVMLSSGDTHFCIKIMSYF